MFFISIRYDKGSFYLYRSVKHIIYCNKNATQKITVNMESSTDKLVAVVTGASSGIGAATALKLASKGYKVVGLAINFDKVIIE